jgi:Na+/melibiose symporter-like transporter
VADTASQSIIPTIVNSKDLEKANSRFEMTYTVIQDFVGAPLGGLLYGIAIALPFVVNGSAFAVAAVLCFLIPFTFTAPEKNVEESRFSTFKKDVTTGMSYLWKTRDLKKLVFTTSLVGFSFSFAGGTMILFLVEDLHLNPRNFGFMMSLMGIFSLIGAYLAPKNAKRFGRGRTMVVALNISTFSILLATYQRLIPQELYARVHGARRTIIWGSMPIASFLGGFVAKINLRLPWLIGGTCALFFSLLNSRFMASMGDSVES